MLLGALDGRNDRAVGIENDRAGNRLSGVDWNEFRWTAVADRKVCIGLRT